MQQEKTKTTTADKKGNLVKIRVYDTVFTTGEQEQIRIKSR